jgi:outer membrane lipopolysaccharide assembly protein LptE/RlpB
LDDATAAGETICDIDLTRRLAPEFSAVCGQADVRAAIVSEMRRRMQNGLSGKGMR